VSIIVQKYGGSSVADVEKIGIVADKVVATRNAGHQVVVVVSAMGKTTDQLLALAKQIDENPARRELDMLLTTGERVTMALLSMAIQKRGADALSFTGSQSGIITNDRHFDAKIIEVRPYRIEDELARGRIVIVAGYQGMSYRREITTLGRGGSDTTALALASALGAERAEIYSDVDGVYSADPRVVTDARHIPLLSYDEMQEMAEAGAKVLHAAAIEHARKGAVAIHARATFAPGRETIVRENDTHGAGARAVVGQKGLTRVRARGGPATLRSALEVAEARSISAREVDAGADEGSFLVTTATTPDWGAGRAELERCLGEHVRIEEGLGMVSVVGDGIGRDHGALTLAMDTIACSGEAVLRVTTTPLRMCVLLRESLVDDTTRALHDALVKLREPKGTGATQ